MIFFFVFAFDKIKLDRLNEIMTDFNNAVKKEDEDKDKKYKLEDDGWARTAYKNIFLLFFFFEKK